MNMLARSTPGPQRDNMETSRPEIDLQRCFREAWRGFSLWWIPLCIVSAIGFASEWVRRTHMKTTLAHPFAPFVDAWRLLWAHPSPDGAEQFIATCQRLIADPAVGPPLITALMTVIKVTLVFALVACVLNVAIVVIAKNAVQPRRESIDVRHYAKRSPLLAASYAVLALIKVVPFFFFVLPGVVLYVRLYFTSFLITEESASPFTAMRQSWIMTRGVFMPLLMLFIANVGVDLIAAVTIVGFIPANSFNYTLRAAAYRQLSAAGLRGVPDQEGPRGTGN